MSAKAIVQGIFFCNFKQYEVSEITENNEELQRDNKELQKVIKELESTADQKEEVYIILLSNVAHRMYGIFAPFEYWLTFECFCCV